MLNSTYAEKVIRSAEQCLDSKDRYIDALVNGTFSAEVLSDLKTGIKQTDGLELMNLTPAAVCKLLTSALINKEYASLPELFSKVDLRGIHTRLKTTKKPAEPVIKLHRGKNYSYRSEELSYEYMLRKIGNYFTIHFKDDEFSDAISKASEHYNQFKGRAGAGTLESEAMDFIDSIPKDNLCLVDVSTMLCRHLCCQSFTDNQVYVDNVIARIRANMELPYNPPIFTYELLPVGNSFRSNFLTNENAALSEHFWQRKHAGLWNGLLTAYACSLFGRKLDRNQAVQKMLSTLAGIPYANSPKYVCYIGNSKNRLHARIFGVYNAADFKDMYANALKYYSVHPHTYRNRQVRNDDIYKTMKLSCVTAYLKLTTPEKYLDYAKLYSVSQLW